MQKDKDIQDIFKGVGKISLSPEKKDMIRKRILPQPSFWWNPLTQHSSFLALASFAIFFVGVAMYVYNPYSAQGPIVLDTATSKDSNVSLYKNTAPTQDMSEGAFIPPGLGGGASPSTSSAEPMYGIAARQSSDLAPVTNESETLVADGLLFEVRDLWDGYDTTGTITASIVVRNITNSIASLQFSNGCQSYYVLDTRDSRDETMCIEALQQIDLLPNEEHTWEVAIDLREQPVSYGTHQLTVGIEVYYEYTKDITFE